MELTTFFASLTLVELSPILGIFAGMLLGFYALVKFMLGQATISTTADRTERQELSKAIENMASAMRDVADSNARIADESKERNGHLAEITVQSRDQVLGAITNINSQNVTHQVVEHQEVQG